uniref:Uncharacterized protein n=1 Tax=Octopus bimaculoides TaxID=37653 RepID=A0A0L8GUX1_OCTBM
MQHVHLQHRMHQRVQLQHCVHHRMHCGQREQQSFRIFPTCRPCVCRGPRHVHGVHSCPRDRVHGCGNQRRRRLSHRLHRVQSRRCLLRVQQKLHLCGLHRGLLFHSVHHSVHRGVKLNCLPEGRRMRKQPGQEWTCS